MNYHIIKTSKTELDITEKLSYLKEQNVSKKTITQLYYLFFSTIKSLEIFPQMYQKVYKDYHRVIVKSYSIFYKINDNTKEVTIYRLLHQSQNFKKNLD